MLFFPDQHTGTSASSPMAAGIIALALEANKGTNQRVIEILSFKENFIKLAKKCNTSNRFFSPSHSTFSSFNVSNFNDTNLKQVDFGTTKGLNLNHHFLQI